MTDSSKKSTTGRKKPTKAAKTTAPKKTTASKAGAKTKPTAPVRAAGRKTVGATAKRAPKATAAPDIVVAALADVGFGNQLFIRGEGAGLSWDRGIPMTCVEASRWEWTARRVTTQLQFKVLINDQLWSCGENFTAQPGESKVVQPDF